MQVAWDAPDARWQRRDAGLPSERPHHGSIRVAAEHVDANAQVSFGCQYLTLRCVFTLSQSVIRSTLSVFGTLMQTNALASVWRPSFFRHCVEHKVSTQPDLARVPTLNLVGTFPSPLAAT